MISIPPRWRVVPEAGWLELVHPDGRAIALIQYRERMRPLHPVGRLVEEYLALEPHFVAGKAAIVERLVTEEGEHAALTTLAGTEASRAVQHDLGFVFGDDFFATVRGRCFVESRFAEVTAIVRQLVIGDSHGLGVRRRRFEYTPPAGWEPVVDTFVTDWYPPGFPAESILLTMRPASPRTLGPLELLMHTVHELSVGGHVVEIETPASPAPTHGPLSGVQVTFRVRPAGAATVLKQITILQDALYTYVVEVTASDAGRLAAHAALTADVVASIRPVPHAQGAKPDIHAFSHWSE